MEEKGIASSRRHRAGAGVNTPGRQRRATRWVSRAYGTPPLARDGFGPCAHMWAGLIRPSVRCACEDARARDQLRVSRQVRLLLHTEPIPCGGVWRLSMQRGCQIERRSATFRSDQGG